MSDVSDSKRSLRYKQKKVYIDSELDDDDIEGRRTYSLEEKLESTKYDANFVKPMKGEDVTLKYFQESGFTSPLVIYDKTGLGIRIPSQNFHVSDVKRCVGSRRILDVMDVTTQTATNMNMKEWVKYYEDTENRKRLLNVISLEFSHTKLETYVQQPEVVRQVDWVENTWPQYLKDMQRESTNLMDRMMYPKVQKYTLMSVAGCYTDFHIDMGGTSVWYHILHGKKIFWLIAPTSENIAAYEAWIMSANQGAVFLGDKVSECQRVDLVAGNTFFIPAGWIHAVFTPEDSLVFGGNFLHSYNISMQLKVWQVECKTHVAGKFRYPFFLDIHWYVLQRYVSLLTGKEHRVKCEDELAMEVTSRRSKKKNIPDNKVDLHDDRSNDSLLSDKSLMSETDNDSCKSPRIQSGSVNTDVDGQSVKDEKLKSTDPIAPLSTALQNSLITDDDMNVTKTNSNLKVHSTKWTHLTCHERRGLRDILELFKHTPRSKWAVPLDIPDPESLLQDTKQMLAEHASDDQESAISGHLLLKWPERKVKSIPRQFTGTPRGHGVKKPEYKAKYKGKERSGQRHRRVRCKLCEPCTRSECRECKFCRDMKKFGGSGTMKQCCISKQCLAPVLANKAQCGLCFQQELTDSVKAEQAYMHVDVEVSGGALYECSYCWEIVHPYCVLLREMKEKKEEFKKEAENSESDENVEIDFDEDTYVHREGLVNEDLPSSWECPRCCDQEKVERLKVESLDLLKKDEADDVCDDGEENKNTTMNTTTDCSLSDRSPPFLAMVRHTPPAMGTPKKTPPKISPIPECKQRNVPDSTRQSLFDVLSNGCSPVHAPSGDCKSPVPREVSSPVSDSSPDTVHSSKHTMAYSDRSVNGNTPSPPPTHHPTVIVKPLNNVHDSNELSTTNATQIHHQTPQPSPPSDPTNEPMPHLTQSLPHQKSTNPASPDSNNHARDLCVSSKVGLPSHDNGLLNGTGMKRKNGDGPSDTSSSQPKKVKSETNTAAPAAPTIDHQSDPMASLPQKVNSRGRNIVMPTRYLN